MQIHEETTDTSVTVLSLTGRLDSNTCGELESRLFHFIDAGVEAIVVDFADLDYVSSAGLRVLLMGAKRIRGQGKLALCGLNDNIREVFKMSGFDKILTIAPTRAEALAAVV